MSTDIADLDISTVLEEDEIDALGELVNVKETISGEPMNVEVREFENKEVSALTAPVFNMAKELHTDISSLEGKDVHEEIQEAIDRFAREFGGTNEYPVYISDPVFNALDEEERVPAMMRLQGVPTRFPVKLRSVEDFEEDIENTRYRFSDGFLDRIDQYFVKNNFVVPGIYPQQDGLPERLPATVIRQRGNQMVVSPDDPVVNSYLENLQTEELDQSYDGLHVDVQDEVILVDTSRTEYDEINSVMTDDGLSIRVGEEEIYFNEDVEGKVSSTELNNGVYEIDII